MRLRKLLRFKLTRLLMLMMLSLTSFESFGQGTLEIRLSNIQKNSGKVVLEIFNSESNWLKNSYRKAVVPTNQDFYSVSFQVPYGTYAVSIYQDMNDNGKLDSGIFSIPKEPIGFGNNYKPFGKPKFESAAIDFKAASKPQEIKLFKAF